MAKALHLQKWITAVGAKTTSIEPGSPWENGYIESFNARLRDCRLREAQIIIDSWQATTTRSDRTHRSDTNRQLRRCSCQPSSASPAALRRPAPPATLAPAQALSTNIPPGPLNEGRSPRQAEI